MPEMEAIIVENPDPSGPFGAKSIGEPCTELCAAAIVSAINQALGYKCPIRTLPATPEAVLNASQRGGFCMKIEFTLNKKQYRVDAPPGARLIDVIRDDLELTGTETGLRYR